MLNIFINTWGNYNENGADGGEWITLPMDAEELTETMNRIATAMGDSDPEWFVNDSEWTTEIVPFEVHEMDNIERLNERLEEISDLDDCDLEEIAAAVEAFGYTFDEAMDRRQRGCFAFYPGKDLEDVAYELVEACYFTENTPEIFRSYFDYEAFARDLRYDGYHETKYGVICDC